MKKKRTKITKTEKTTATTSIELNLAARTKDVITYGQSETRRLACKTNGKRSLKFKWQESQSNALVKNANC